MREGLNTKVANFACFGPSGLATLKPSSRSRHDSAWKLTCSRGCVRCKTRRVKCDEKAPCTNCTRRAEHCSLNDAQSPSVASVSEPFERDGSLPASREEYLQDMELWFHYNHSLELVNLGHREDIT
ncbi:hypothetical protein KC337_g56 [Hortaea werneckii]|nr:hypothetical protein KC337_g56 [Hortaea werneckii]